MQLSLKRNAHKGQIKRIMIGALVGHIISILFLTISSVLIYKGTVPESVSKELALACMIVGAIVSGRSAAGEGRGVLSGIWGGLGYIAIAAVIGLYRTQTDYFDLDFIRFLIASMAGSAFGGIISTGKKNKKSILHKNKYTNSNHKIRFT